MAGADTVAISMTWTQWKWIDGTIDNTGSVAAEDLDVEVARPDRVDRRSAGVHVAVQTLGERHACRIGAQVRTSDIALTR